jgi:hypothetical protein
MRKHVALGLAAALALAISPASVELGAQYLKRLDPKTPRLSDGKPNLTAPAPRTRDGKIDLGGVWNNPDGRFLTDLAKRAGVTAPFTPWGAALFKERQDNSGRDRPAGRCLPHSIPNAMLVPLYPWKIVQTPEEVVVLYENFTQYRQIFTDGRGFPVQMDPTWFGNSIGHWDGDILVVETAGLNDKAWLDDGGHPRSEQMRTTEKFRRKDFGHMEIEFTFNDPKAYSQPWSVTVPFELLPDTDLIENICENEKDVVHIFGKQ